MADQEIPESLREWARSTEDGDTKMKELMRLYAEALDCQRCVLYCREPDLRRATTTHAWWSDAKEEYAVQWESWFSDEWVDEGPPNAPDPLFHLALVDPHAVYIDDIENDPTGLVNLEFEAPTFKHRALIHAPIYHAGKCYGILEPSVFDEPRHWSARDKEITAWVQEQLGPIVAEYVATHGPK